MEYYESIAVCKTERELLELWKTKKTVTKSYVDKKQEKTVSINHKNVFISDGIVNETVWNNQNGRKILYVLKEACGENEDWNLTEWLLRTKPSSSIWKRVIEWTYGIQNTTEGRIAKYSPDIYEQHTELFNHIAVVNLKKSGGKSSSNYGEIEAYALADKEEIKKQLSLIAPDIILCGSTFGALNHVFDDKIRPDDVQCDNWFYFPFQQCDFMPRLDGIIGISFSSKQITHYLDYFFTWSTSSPTSTLPVFRMDISENSSEFVMITGVTV